jgi:hypothetical protein
LGYYRSIPIGPVLLTDPLLDGGTPAWISVDEDQDSRQVTLGALSVGEQPIDALIWLLHSVKKPNMVTAEVGVWQGETLIHYANLIKKLNGKVYAIDWFKGNLENTAERSPTGGARHAFAKSATKSAKIELNLCHNLKVVGASEHIEILRGDSVEMSKHIADNSLDLCFIDADHSYKGVKRDIEAYYPKVKEGGIICGHDCLDINLANTFTQEQIDATYLQIDDETGCHPGVIQAVYEKFGYDVKIIPCHTVGIPVWAARKGGGDIKLIRRPQVTVYEGRRK